MGKKRRTAAVLAVVLLIVGATVLGVARLGGRGGRPASPPRMDGGAVAVTTVQTGLGSIARTLEVGGEVVAEESVQAHAEIAGRVSAVLVEVGAEVSRGQVIARIDPSRPGMQYAESPVAAPITGTVLAVAARVGETISTTTPLITIGRVDRLMIETRIPERFIGQVPADTPAVFTLAAWPGVEFAARVVRLDPLVDPGSRTLKVTLAPARPDERVKPGMYATVAFTTERKERAVTVPAESVITRGTGEGGSFVYVVEDGRAVRRIVATGIAAGGRVEISDGLEPGEEVVVSGQSLLADGAQVRVVGGQGFGEREPGAGGGA